MGDTQTAHPALRDHMCGPQFCAMKITKDVRRQAAEHGLTEQEALRKSMEEKSCEFVQNGAALYAEG